MSTRITVSNLPHSATKDEVRELFSRYGTVNSVDLLTDRETGRPTGTGIVDMSSGAEDAIVALNGEDMGGRELEVKETRSRPNYRR